MELTGHKRSTRLGNDQDSNIDMSIDENDLPAQHISKRRIKSSSHIGNKDELTGKNSLSLGRRWLLGNPTNRHEFPLVECPGIGESSDIQPFPNGN